jgi:hypothetical protein
MTFKERAEKRCTRPGNMARLMRLKDADRSFDYEFWQNQSVEARFAAMWQLVIDMRILRGEDEVEPRLLRAYPKTPAARKVMYAQVRWRKAS